MQEILAPAGWGGAPAAHDDIQFDLRDDFAIVSVVGEVDAFNVRTFADMLHWACGLETRGLIVDVTRATYLCARTFGVLRVLATELARRPPENGCPLLLACPPGHFARRLAATLDLHVTIAGSTLEACARLRPLARV